MSKAIMVTNGHVGGARQVDSQFALAAEVQRKRIASHNPTQKPAFAMEELVFVTKHLTVSFTLLVK